MKVNVSRKKRLQTAFAGLDHNQVVREGYLYDMENLSGDLAPALSVRRGRTRLKNIPGFHGLGAAEGKLYWVSGTDFVYDGAVLAQVSDTDKVFGRLGSRLVIWPDKLLCDLRTGTVEAAELSETVSAVFTAYNWDAASEEAEAVYQGNAIRASAALPFAEGDAVFVEGSAVEENNRSAVIRRVLEDGKLLVFTNNLFTETDTAETVTLSRKVPDADWVCQMDNRLWACGGDDIYACALGLPAVWYDYDVNASSSYAVPVGSDGDFTGAGVIGGYAVFFKPDAIHKLYGDRPSNFQVMASAVSGCIDGRSIAIAGETMFYLSRTGVMAYKGGTPVCVSEALGTARFIQGVAGSDGRRYYVSLFDGSGWSLYVYDTQTGLWFREDSTQALGFAEAGGTLYMADAAGDLWSLGTAASDGVAWALETGDLCDNDPDKLGLGRLQVRMELDAGAEAAVKLQFDGSGPWQTCRTVAGENAKKMFVIPIIPRRCGHYRLRVEGTGGCRIYGIAREYYRATEL